MILLVLFKVKGRTQTSAMDLLKNLERQFGNFLNRVTRKELASKFSNWILLIGNLICMLQMLRESIIQNSVIASALGIKIALYRLSQKNVPMNATLQWCETASTILIKTFLKEDFVSFSEKRSLLVRQAHLLLQDVFFTQPVDPFFLMITKNISENVVTWSDVRIIREV